MQSTQNSRYEKRAKRGLLLGAVLGLVTAAIAAAPSQQSVLSTDGAIARVNQSHIDRTEFASAYQALISDKNKAPSEADKKMALDRLIEEELLVQRGLEIGLLDGDNSVRKAVASAVIQFAIAQNPAPPISETDLTTYYQDNLARFTPASRLHIERIYVSAAGKSAAQLAAKLDDIRNALRGGDSFAEVAARLGEPILPDLPKTLLPRAKMIDYLGPELTEAASYLAAGSISDALKSQNGYQFIYVVANQPGQPRPFAELRPQIAKVMQRQRDDQALRDYINWLRARADINLATDAPQ